MIQLYKLLLLVLIPHTGSHAREERGASAVEWLIVTGAAVGIAYFAGDSVLSFAKGLVGGLGK